MAYVVGTYDTHLLNYVRNERYVPGCASSTFQEWSEGASGWELEFHYNEPDRRLRPSPLIWNPTTRGPLSRQTCQYISLEKIVPIEISTCYDTYPPVNIEGGFNKETQWIEPYQVVPEDDIGNDALVTPILLGIKDSSMNLAEFIGEYRETVDMVSSGVKKVVEVIRDIRDVARGKRPKTGVFARRPYRYFTPRNWKKKLRVLPSAMLLSDFGLAPMIDGATEALSTWDTRATKPIIRRITLSRSKMTDIGDTGSGWDDAFSGTRITSKRAIVYVRYDPARDLAYTAGNILEANWAAIPFSFLVDKFVNVGDWLSSLDAMDGVMTTAGTITTKITQDTWHEELPVTWRAAGWYLKTAGSTHYESYRRDLLGWLEPTSVAPRWNPSGSARLLRDLTGILASFNLGR